MAGKKSGFDMMSESIAKGPSAKALGVSAAPSKTTMGTGGDAPRKDVARNPSGG